MKRRTALTMKDNRDRPDAQLTAQCAKGKRWSAQKQERRIGINAVNRAAIDGSKMAGKGIDANIAASSYARNVRDEQWSAVEHHRADMSMTNGGMIRSHLAMTMITQQ
jgi:hypothetical protein